MHFLNTIKFVNTLFLPQNASQAQIQVIEVKFNIILICLPPPSCKMVETVYEYLI
jgi:hypothetical protein